MAPEAPTVGTVEVGFISACTTPAIAPQSRKKPTKRAEPIADSTARPNTQRKSMLPSRCSNPAWRKSELARRATSGSAATSPESNGVSRDGTSAQRATSAVPSAGGSRATAT